MSPQTAAALETAVEEAVETKAETKPETKAKPVENVTPEIIAKMSQSALKAVEAAGEELRDLARYCGTMGEQTKEEIEALADEIVQHGRATATHVVNYATDMHERCTRARELRNSIPAGPRIVSRQS